MPEINPLTKDQLFEKKIAENTGSNYNVGDISDVVPVTKDQSLLKEIALNSAGLSEELGALTERVKGESTSVSSCYFYKHSDGTISVSGLAVLPMTIPEGFEPTNAIYAIAQGYHGSTENYLTFYPDGMVAAGDSGEQTGKYFVSCTYK